MHRSAPAAALLALLSGPAGAAPTIYGQDDRVELRDLTDPRLLEAARGVAALVDWEDIEVGQNSVKLKAALLHKAANLEPGDRFAQQPTAASCTASLVAADLVLTAGHCQRRHPCKTTAYIFDYAYDLPGRDPTAIPFTSVGICAEVVAAVHSMASDWALLRLRRPLPDRPLLNFASSTPEPGTPLVMLGFPTGLPMKAAWGKARGLGEDWRVFYAAINAFGGNSGSAVFNADTMEVVGLLIGGEHDFIPPEKIVDVVTALKRLRPRNRRSHYYVVPADGGEGERILRLETFINRLKKKLEPAAVPFDGSDPHPQH